jgi:hypothetical protein
LRTPAWSLKLKQRYYRREFLKCSLAAALNLALLLCGSALAQTATTPISFSLTGRAVGTFGGGGPTLQGTGSINPYGQMTFVGSESAFTFSGGDIIQAQAAVSGSKSTVTATLTIQSTKGELYAVPSFPPNLRHTSE